MKKLQKVLFALTLLVIMMATTVTPAFASATGGYDNPLDQFYLFDDVVKVTSSPNGDGTVTVYETRWMSAAQKITTLNESLFPAQYLCQELARMERLNDPDIVRYELKFSFGLIDDQLSESTKGALSVLPCQDAEEFLALLKGMPEYQNRQFKQGIDEFLEFGLDSTWLKRGFESLTSAGYAGPEHDKPFGQMTLGELVAYGRTFVATDEFQALEEVFTDLQHGHVTAYELTGRFTSEELDALWERLAAAAEPYRPGQAAMLSNMEFTTYVGTFPMQSVEACG